MSEVSVRDAMDMVGGAYVDLVHQLSDTPLLMKLYKNRYLVVIDYEYWLNSFEFYPDYVRIVPYSSYYDVKQYRDSSKYYFVPFYEYNHSGSVVSLRPFSDSWDSYQAGLIYADRKEVKNSETFLDLAQQLINKYNQYLSGDVYCAKVYDIVTHEFIYDAFMNEYYPTNPYSYEELYDDVIEMIDSCCTS